MIKTLIILTLSLISLSCQAIQPPIPAIKDRVVTCEAPATREDGQILDITEIDYYKITYGLVSDNGTGTELRTADNNCYLLLPPLLAGDYHAYAIVRSTDDLESQPIETQFTVNAGPQGAGNFEVK